MKEINLLQTLLADLMKLNVNLHNMHWNVVGYDFAEYHELTEDFYNDVFEKYDDIAEILKTRDVYPVSSLKEYDELSKIKDYEVKDYTKEEITKNLKEIYEYLIASFKEIREEADDNDNYVLVATMEDYIGDYSKKLWMINSRLK
ncbi:starvation-inducible DNA-binding protein [Bacilli bacterium PM5-3]|nr:starvation-inducible DNA-binding protein [Bacilli bacterium PM5-3]MDH6603029.1 starvation-inducible DNA-binding protein [Bacilli bacterium PM5-9]